MCLEQGIEAWEGGGVLNLKRMGLVSLKSLPFHDAVVGGAVEMSGAGNRYYSIPIFSAWFWGCPMLLHVA